jgi:hypothetical protein
MSAPNLYQQRPDLDIRIVDGEAFVITRTTIQHLNPVATAVWLTIEEPARQREAVDLLAELYPVMARDTLQRDARRILKQLLAAGLATARKTSG